MTLSPFPCSFRRAPLLRVAAQDFSPIGMHRSIVPVQSLEVPWS
jgi:hypothetical protein